VHGKGSIIARSSRTSLASHQGSTAAQPQLSGAGRRSAAPTRSSASQIACPQLGRSNGGYTSTAIDRERPPTSVIARGGLADPTPPDLVLATKSMAARAAGCDSLGRKHQRGKHQPPGARGRRTLPCANARLMTVIGPTARAARWTLTRLDGQHQSGPEKLLQIASRWSGFGVQLL
jgi:hypothetical protein